MTDCLIHLLKNIFPHENLSEHSSKQDIPSWDSLTHMDLVTTIEKHFEITLSMEDIVEMTSIKNIVEVLNQHKVPKN